MPASLRDTTTIWETSISCHSSHPPVAESLPGCRWLPQIQEAPFLSKIIKFGCFFLQVKKNRINKLKAEELGRESQGFIFVQVKKRPQIIFKSINQVCSMRELQCSKHLVAQIPTYTNTVLAWCHGSADSFTPLTSPVLMWARCSLLINSTVSVSGQTIL